MSKAWIVNKDTGQPMAWVTVGDKSRLTDQGHYLVHDPIPNGNKNPTILENVPYVRQGNEWVIDKAENNRREAAKAAEDAKASSKAAAVSRLKGRPDPVSKDIVEALGL